MIANDRVQHIALVSQRNAENRRHKNTMFIKPRNFCIPFSLHGDRTAILGWQNSKNIQLSAIFPCAMLLAWTRSVDSLLSCWHTRDWWFELSNESEECNLNFLHARERWFQLTNESAECNLISCWTNLVPRAFSSFKMAVGENLAKAAKVAPKVR